MNRNLIRLNMEWVNSYADLFYLPTNAPTIIRLASEEHNFDIGEKKMKNAWKLIVKPCLHSHLGTLELCIYLNSDFSPPNNS